MMTTMLLVNPCWATQLARAVMKVRLVTNTHKIQTADQHLYRTRRPTVWKRHTTLHTTASNPEATVLAQAAT